MSTRWAKFGLDLGAWTFAVPAAFFLRMEGAAFGVVDSIVALVLLGVPLQAFLMLRLGFHRQSWGLANGADVKRLTAGVGVWTVVLGLETLFLRRLTPIPRSVPVIAGALALLLLVGMRLTVRWWAEHRRSRRAGLGRRVLLVGASASATALARDLSAHPELGLTPVGFVDDDRTLHGLLRQGLPVLGTVDDLPEVAAALRASEAVVALPRLGPSDRRRLAELAERAGIPLRIAPTLPDLAEGGRHVLVIGGAGYIGSALVPLLLDAGHRVRVLDLLIYGDEAIRPYVSHPRLELLHGDFRQVDKVIEAVQGVDTVVHLGGLVGDPACALDEDLTVEVNLMATKMIAEVAKGYGVSRFVFASTCSVYGEMDGILTETSDVNPISLYARTKLASEKVLLRLADDRFAPTILRFGTVYGFSGRTRFDLVVNLLAAKAVTEGVVTLYGGDQWRPFVHVEDVARAVFLAVTAPPRAVAGKVLNVGSDAQNMTLAELAERVRAVVPDATVVDKGANSDKRNYRVSFARIRDELGFEPKWTVEAGIRQVAEALRTGRVKDYRMPIHSNVRYLTEEGLSKLVRRELLGALDALDEEPRPEPAGRRNV